MLILNCIIIDTQNKIATDMYIVNTSDNITTQVLDAPTEASTAMTDQNNSTLTTPSKNASLVIPNPQSTPVQAEAVPKFSINSTNNNNSSCKG